MPFLVELLIYFIAIYALILAVYFLLQDFLIFRPKQRKAEQEYRLSASYEEFFFDTSGKGHIHGLLLHPNGKPRGLIFYLHGNTGSMKRWSKVAQELLDLDYDIFVMDYRGYGKSKGRRSEAALHRDVLEVFDEVSKAYRGLELVVYGRSLGTGFAVPLAAQRPVDKLVLETPFFNLIHVAQTYAPFVPIRYLLRFPMRSDLSIQKVQCPILIFHGTADRIVPYRSGFALYNKVRYRDDVRLVTIPGAQHNNLNAYPTFWDSLRVFLSRR